MTWLLLPRCTPPGPRSLWRVPSAQCLSKWPFFIRGTLGPARAHPMLGCSLPTPQSVRVPAQGAIPFSVPPAQVAASRALISRTSPCDLGRCPYKSYR